MSHTPNGYDPQWVALINDALADGEVELRIADVSDEMWEGNIGPLLDALEAGEVS